MKTKINSLDDALTYLMQGLYYTESRLIQDIDSCCPNIKIQAVKREIEKYKMSSHNKLLKLERVFNYLMKEPITRKNEVTIKLLEETRNMLASSAGSNLRDQMAIACIQNINAYKVTTYRTVYMYAIELELETVADIIQQVLEWETAESKVLNNLAIECFNNSQRSTTC